MANLTRVHGDICMKDCEFVSCLGIGRYQIHKIIILFSTIFIVHFIFEYILLVRLQRSSLFVLVKQAAMSPT